MLNSVIKGIDAGYTYLKTPEIIFPSKITTKERIFKDSTEVEMDGKIYTVGEGDLITDMNKVDSDLTKLIILTGLAKSSPDCNNFYVVTGLPIAQYNAQKDQLKAMLLQRPTIDLKIDGTARKIRILGAEVFPQCAGAFYTIPNSELEDGLYLAVDWGGRTVDISLWEIRSGKRKPVNFTTIAQGSLILYSDIVKYVNAKYDMCIDIEEGERIVDKRVIDLYGRKEDLGSIIDAFKAEQVETVFKHINISYPQFKIAKHLGCGGAFKMYSHDYKKRMPVRMMPNSQKANAIGFEIVGRTLKWD